MFVVSSIKFVINCDKVWHLISGITLSQRPSDEAQMLLMLLHLADVFSYTSGTHREIVNCFRKSIVIRLVCVCVCVCR